MNTIKHTAAPCHVNKELSRTGNILIYGHDKYLVANVGSYRRDTETDEANAALIAAAPALLAALKAARAALTQPVQSTPNKGESLASQGQINILRADAVAALTFINAAITQAEGV